jgi:hypothetical protein
VCRKTREGVRGDRSHQADLNHREAPGVFGGKGRAVRDSAKSLASARGELHVNSEHVARSIDPTCRSAVPCGAYSDEQLDMARPLFCRRDERLAQCRCAAECGAAAWFAPHGACHRGDNGREETKWRHMFGLPGTASSRPRHLFAACSRIRSRNSPIACVMWSESNAINSADRRL